jgi:hypothetical protein
MKLTFLLASKHPDWDDGTDLDQNGSPQISHIELPRNSSFPMDHFAGTIESHVGQAMRTPKNSDANGLTPSLLISSAPLLQETAAHDIGFSEIARHGNCGTAPFPCPVSDDASLPQLASRTDLPSSCFVYNTSFPQQMASQNGSAMYPEQAGASTRPAVFSDADFVYKSRAFMVQIFLDVMMFAAPFIYMMHATWRGELSAADFVISSPTFWVPMIFGPSFLWFTIILCNRIMKS